MAGGALAPQVVVVAVDMPDAEPEVREPTKVDFDSPQSGVTQPPLSIEFNSGFKSELLDLQHLFTRSRPIDGPMSRRFSRLLNFPRSHGDVIVMDDVDRRIRDVVFKDPVLVGAITDGLEPDPSILSLDFPRPLGDGLTFDDPLPGGPGGPPPPPDLADVGVPEPGTIGLTPMGLVLLAMRRRRSGLRRQTARR